MSPGEAINVMEAAAGFCPNDLSGILVCPKEWQTLFAGALALFAGLAVYFSARHQTRSAKLAEERNVFASQKAAAISLAVEIKEIENSAISAAETLNEIVEKGETIDLHVAAIFSQTGPELNHELRIQVANLQNTDLAEAAMDVFGNAKKLREASTAQLKRFGPDSQFAPDALKQLHGNFTNLGKLAARTRKELIRFAAAQDL